MTELNESTPQRKPDLVNFFVECNGCGYDLRFDYLDQTRICPQCGKTISLSKEYKDFLRQEKEETRRWLAGLREGLRK